MKKCGRCGVVKPLSEFHRWRQQLVQPWCKECRKAYDKKYYERNKEHIVDLKRQRRIQLTESHASLKSEKACADCRARFHPAAMTWDHIPGAAKRGEVSNLVKGHSRDTVLVEIAKCELVCANCHAVRTFERRRDVAQPG